MLQQARDPLHKSLQQIVQLSFQEALHGRRCYASQP